MNMMVRYVIIYTPANVDWGGVRQEERAYLIDKIKNNLDQGGGGGEGGM